MALLLPSLLLALLLALGLALAAPGRAKPLWNVGTDPSYAPFGFTDGDSGKLRGFDIELIEAIAKRSGHRLQLTPLPFDGLIPALQVRNLDLAISAMTMRGAVRAVGLMKVSSRGLRRIRTRSRCWPVGRGGSDSRALSPLRR